MPGRPMRGYTVLPSAMADDPAIAGAWVDRAIGHLASPAPKEVIRGDPAEQESLAPTRYSRAGVVGWIPRPRRTEMNDAARLGDGQCQVGPHS